jgi:DNA-directed RNA polymerase delta subunit
MEQLKNKIEILYNDYTNFEKVVKEKNKVITEKQNSIKELLDGKSAEDIEDVLVHIYVDTILYNKDLQMLFFKLVTNIETYLEFSKEPLSEEVIEFYNSMKTWIPKKVFVLEKGDLVETEVGTLDKARKEFMESDFFKGLLQQATK